MQTCAAVQVAIALAGGVQSPATQQLPLGTHVASGQAL